MNDVIPVLSAPLKDAYDLESGPGGMGNTDQFERCAQGFKKDIQDRIKNGGMTGDQVWELKKKIAKNTSWTAPGQEALKGVRQGQVVALSGVLTNKFPELGQLNPSYGDLLKYTDLATERAATGSSSLSNTHCGGKCGWNGDW